MQQEAREEILRVVGDEEVNDDHLSQLVYLRSIIFETARMRSPAINFDRVTTADVEIGGHRLPKGTGKL